MFYYTAKLRYLPTTIKFKSTVEMYEGQCFKIVSKYEFANKHAVTYKVTSVSDKPVKGVVREITDLNLNVEQF